MSATHHQLTTGTELTSSKRQKHINRAYFLLVIFAALLMMLGSVDKGNNGLDLWLSPMSSVAASALGPISGVVFNDGNNNGLKDTAEVG